MIRVKKARAAKQGRGAGILATEPTEAGKTAIGNLRSRRFMRAQRRASREKQLELSNGTTRVWWPPWEGSHRIRISISAYATACVWLTEPLRLVLV